MSLLKDFFVRFLLKVFFKNENNVLMVKMINSRNFLPLRVIFKSPKNDNMWQMQIFDINMEPKLDYQYNTLLECILCQLEMNFKIKEIHTKSQAHTSHSQKILFQNILRLINYF